MGGGDLGLAGRAGEDEPHRLHPLAEGRVRAHLDDGGLPPGPFRLADGLHGRPPRLAPEDVSWFRISVGRDKYADPTWLIPMICRLGHITKKDIGSIRIFDRETKFEISKEAEAKFASAVKPTVNDEIKIEASSPPGGPTSPPRGGPHRKGPPGGDRPFRKGPPGEGKPFRKGPAHEGGKPAFKGPPGSPGPKAGKPPWKKKGNDQRK